MRFIMFNVNGISSFPYRMMVCALCLSWANVYIMSFCTKYYLLFCVHMLKVFVNLWNWLRNIDNMVFPASRFGSITYLVTALRNILFKPKAKNRCWRICPNLNGNIAILIWRLTTYTNARHDSQSFFIYIVVLGCPSSLCKEILKYKFGEGYDAGYLWCIAIFKAKYKDTL